MSQENVQDIIKRISTDEGFKQELLSALGAISKEDNDFRQQLLSAFDIVSTKDKHDKVDCFKLQENGKSPSQIAMDRCDCLIQQYLDWKEKNHKKSTWAQGSALVFTAAIPVILLVQLEYVNIIGAALSALAAISTGLLAINGWRENFIRYGYIFHMLQVEKYLYKAQATREYPDDDPQKATRNFVKRIEGLVTLDVTEWRTEMQRIDERS